MKCRKCSTELVDGARFCHACGTDQNASRPKKQRGNGQGSVYKRGNRWIAVVTLGYEARGIGEPRRLTRSKSFAKKSDAIAALPGLKAAAPKRPGTDITFKQLYDLWLPTHRAGKSAIGNYTAAIKHLRPVWNMRMDEITVDDLQECLDECPAGKRTRENMRAVVSLVYKYGIPRNHIPMDRNLSPFLVAEGDAAAHRESFSTEQIRKILKIVPTVKYASYVYCMIYLGFRPTEFLSLTHENYHADQHYFIGGAKTAAGIDRLVPIKQIIQSYVAEADAQGGETIFCRADGKRWTRDAFTDVFYDVLDAAGIDNPMVQIAGGMLRHKYTPHSCRHTFATLMKKVDAPSKDKQAVIGHASDAQLKYYQDAPLDDLRRLVEAI